MQPGDIYQPPPGSQPRRDNPYAAQPPQPPGQPGFPPPQPPLPHSSSHQRIASNPFNHPADNQQWAPPAPPRPPTTDPQYRPSTAQSYHSSNVHNPPNIPLQRMDSPYNLGDPRLTSPPPMGGSHTDLSYPPRQQPGGYGPAEDDYGDAQPLLGHAYPDPRLGGHATPSPRPYQLTDNGATPGHGDMGIRFDPATRFNAPPSESRPYNDEPGSNLHYGPVPNRVLRRNRTQKKVQLFRGHLVLDVEVPSLLLDQSLIKEGNEFTKMRYTAVTCDPNDFVEDKYTLRQRLYDPPRQTELFIVVTMYNEDDVLFCRTMRGIMQNVAHLCSRSRSKTWGQDGWKKVVVCIVSDGRAKINPRTRSVLAALGVYQDGVGKNMVNGKPVTAHLYEYTTQLSISSSGKIGPGGNNTVPIQLIFCLKEKNQKKINSHRWFFNAFGDCLRPNVCVLLDVGTQPGPKSIYHLWKAFDINSSVGGACGEIVALKGTMGINLINPLVAAQNFEYKMSNILDKPLESVFGYITVLPGAFSAYRYIALQNDERGQGPLEKYFYGETMHGAGAGIFKANMYLAEDRILCWELVSKRGSKWLLHYVKSSYATTDVPDAVPELVSQRRRWLNGSFFAAIHSIVHFGYIYRSSYVGVRTSVLTPRHNFGRKFLLHVELIYQIISNVFAWFALGNFYIAFVVLTDSMDPYGKVFHILNKPLHYAYIALLMLCFILALGNRPQGSKWGYTLAMVGFALITVYMIFCAVFLAIKGVEGVKESGGLKNPSAIFGSKIFANIVISLAATYGLYIVSSIISLDPWHLITSFIQYLLLAASYVNVLNVYAFCNVHDVSWGTKGSDKASEDLGVVKSDGGGNEVVVEVPVEQKDINATYQEELAILASKPPPESSGRSADQKQEDYYKNFRTNVLLAWTMTNALLAGIILGTNTNLATTYMGIMLYTVAGLAFFRFVGAVFYLVIRLFMGE
ncbi:Chitin synthase 4 [Vanrija pseudolonga]|uniref:Chitin synthase n=1 Tax=Vanrija pseudolonga TaxID=143232 RepID=A0AAF0YHK1_9TREE|nr:Chitin synthase 4 [Vanrija pseudolonga]